MQFFTAVVLFAAAAFAAPGRYSGDADVPALGPVINNQPDNSCGAHNTQACCNDSTNNVGNTGLVQIEGVLKNLAGGTCARTDVLDLINFLDEDSKCDMQTFCCDNNKFDNNGLTVLGNCNPITVNL